MKQLNDLGLFDCESIPAFDEVTQQVAEFLRVPICVVTIADSTTEYVKAAYGLSHLGLGNSLARLRQMPLAHGLGTYVLDSEQPLFITDTGENAVIAASQLAYTYGIGAYGAVPLMTSGGDCIGTLAIMDRQPRNFSLQEQGYMAMASRWGMSEYERWSYQSLASASSVADQEQVFDTQANPRQSLIDAVRLHLIGELTQDLRSPLTAVLGMTSLLGQEIYGPLTAKQREYVEVVHNSSRILMERVQDIVELGLFEPEHRVPEMAPVDIDMLGQQVMNTLEQLASQRSQTLAITTEPGERVWTVDKSIVKQIFYHVMYSIMQLAGENSTVRVHLSRQGQLLQLAAWLSNPWLGEGLPQSVVRLCRAMAVKPAQRSGLLPTSQPWQDGLETQPTVVSLEPEKVSRELLGLLLSQYLAECHGGHIKLQGSLDAGYRLLVVIPSGPASTPQTNPVAFTQA
jgi:signal transduction histidine kinase